MRDTKNILNALNFNELVVSATAKQEKKHLVIEAEAKEIMTASKDHNVYRKLFNLSDLFEQAGTVFEKIMQTKDGSIRYVLGDTDRRPNYFSIHLNNGDQFYISLHDDVLEMNSRTVDIIDPEKLDDFKAAIAMYKVTVLDFIDMAVIEVSQYIEDDEDDETETSDRVISITPENLEKILAISVK